MLDKVIVDFNKLKKLNFSKIACVKIYILFILLKNNFIRLYSSVIY